MTDLCCRFWLGPVAELTLPGGPAPPLSTLAPVALGGALGVLFNTSLLGVLAAADHMRRRVPAWTVGVALGAALGVVASFVPALPGGGVTVAARVLDGSVSTTEGLWLLPASFVLTIGSYAVGAPGGIFAPLLVIGAALGHVFHTAWLAVVPTSATAMPVLAAAGMAALFAGIVRSPLTGAVLLVEMTGSSALVLPLVVASLVAHAVAEGAGSRPIYESLLERELERQRGTSHS